MDKVYLVFYYMGDMSCTNKILYSVRALEEDAKIDAVLLAGRYRNVPYPFDFSVEELQTKMDLHTLTEEEIETYLSWQDLKDEALDFVSVDIETHTVN